MSTAMAAAGTHLLADFDGVAAALLRDAKALERLLHDAACLAGARVISSHFHTFGEEVGVTGVLLLAESHISIHTWPESGFAAIDIFMCGAADPRHAIAQLARALIPQRQQIKEIARGGAAI